MRKFVELLPLAFAIGLTLEVVKSAIPYLPLIWFAVSVFYVYDFIKTPRTLAVLSKAKARFRGKRQLMYSYGLVFVLGGSICALCWWGLNAFFAPKIAAYEAEQQRKKADSESPQTFKPEKERLFTELAVEQTERKELYGKMFSTDLQIALKEQNRKRFPNPAVQQQLFMEEMGLIQNHNQIKNDLDAHERIYAKTLAEIRMRFPGSDKLVDDAAKQLDYTPDNSLTAADFTTNNGVVRTWLTQQSEKFNSIISAQCVEPIDALRTYMQAHLDESKPEDKTKLPDSKPQGKIATYVQERPKDWRRIEDWQKQLLIANLTILKGQKILILVTPGQEALTYAQDFREVLRAAKWQVTGPNKAPRTVMVETQISIYVPSNAADTLKNNLDLVGIPTRSRLVTDADVKPDEPVLWVGPKGPPGVTPDFVAPAGIKPRE